MSSWDENADRTNIDTRIFQRGNAVAERLWSDSSVVDTVDARVRLAEFRCKQNRRIGTTIGPLFPDYCDVQTSNGGGGAPEKPVAPHKTSGAGWVVTAICFIIISVALVFFVFCRMPSQQTAGSSILGNSTRTHNDFNYLALQRSESSKEPFDDIDGDIL